MQILDENEISQVSGGTGKNYDPIFNKILLAGSGALGITAGTAAFILASPALALIATGAGLSLIINGIIISAHSSTN